MLPACLEMNSQKTRIAPRSNHMVSRSALKLSGTSLDEVILVLFCEDYILEE